MRLVRNYDNYARGQAWIVYRRDESVCMYVYVTLQAELWYFFQAKNKIKTTFALKQGTTFWWLVTELVGRDATVQYSTVF
jgi:hypothetical protein